MDEAWQGTNQITYKFEFQFFNIQFEFVVKQLY